MRGSEKALRCQVLTTGHNVLPVRRSKAVSCGDWRLQAATNHLAGVYRLLYVGNAAALKGIWCARQSRLTLPQTRTRFLSPTPRGDYQKGAVPRINVSADAPGLNIIYQDYVKRLPWKNAKTRPSKDTLSGRSQYKGFASLTTGLLILGGKPTDNHVNEAING